MKILILNWRDIRSPFAGGAEIFTYENARRWVKEGHEVTWFASDFGGPVKEETIGGISIIRRGSELTVHYNAFRYYRKFLRGKFDLVIDQINTIPFLTPLYVKEKKIALVHQLTRDVWFYETFFPLSLIGFLAEYFYLKIYRNTPVLTVSQSTKKDLQALGGCKKISIVPEGLAFRPVEEIPRKETEPTLIFVGRLRKSKRVHHAILALSIVKRKIPNIRLRIVGGAGRKGYRKKLDFLVKKLNLEDNVIFYGSVNDQTKIDLIKSSHALLVTSVKEGWGLVASEANALATVSIGYNVSGLRDSIIDGQSGLLTKANNPASLAEAVITCLQDKEFYNRLCSSALNTAKKFSFSWDKSAAATLARIKEEFQGAGGKCLQ
jgi:glycosyltransferase involved in cell wall biosynthesis